MSGSVKGPEKEMVSFRESPHLFAECHTAYTNNQQREYARMFSSLYRNKRSPPCIV